MYGPTLSTEVVAAIFLRFEDLFRKAGKMDMFETLVYNYRLKENLPFQCLQHFASLLNDLIRQLTELSVTLEAGTHVSQSLHKTDYECGPDCEAVVNRFCLMESLLENNDLSDFSMDCADTDICETTEDATVDLIDETVAILSQNNSLIPMQESNVVTCSKDDNQQALYANQDILSPFSNAEKIATKNIASHDTYVCNTSPVGITSLKCNQDFSSEENLSTSQAKFRLQEIQIEQNSNGGQLVDILPPYTEETICINFENQSQLESIISCDETFLSVAEDILTMTQERLDRNNKASYNKPSAVAKESCSKQQGSCNVKSSSQQTPKEVCLQCGKAFLTEKGLKSHEFLTHKKSPEAIAKQRQEEELILKKIGVISCVTQIAGSKSETVQEKTSKPAKAALASVTKPRISQYPLKEGKAQFVSTKLEREKIICSTQELAQCHQCGKTFMTLKGLKSHVALSKTCYKDKMKTLSPVRSVPVIKNPEMIVNTVVSKTKEGTKLGVRNDSKKQKGEKLLRKDVQEKSHKHKINPEHKKIICSLFAECKKSKTDKAVSSRAKDDLNKKDLERNQTRCEKKALEFTKLETVVRIQRADPLIVEKAIKIREKLQKQKIMIPQKENSQDVETRTTVNIESTTHKSEKPIAPRKGLRKREKTRLYKTYKETEGVTKSIPNKSPKLSKPENDNNLSLSSTLELPSGDSVPWIVCEKCVLVFKVKKDFFQHNCIIQGEKCDAQKPRQMTYTRDKEKLDSLHKFICSVCLEEFRSFQRICYHMKKCEIGPYFCEICPTSSPSFETMKLLNTHKRMEHKEQNSYICNECGHSFKYKNSLNKHKVVVHELNVNPEVFKCEFCDEEFSKKVVLTNHKIQAHGQERQFLCQICGIRFSSLASLSAHHAATHDGNKKFQCNYCEKRFPRKDKLLHHEATHTGDKPFCCDICGRRFVRKTRLDDHRRRHAAERRFRCSETGCMKLFASKPDLNNHMKRHTVDKEKAKASEKLKDSDNGVATLEAMINSAEESFEEQLKEKEYMKTDNSFLNNQTTLLQDTTSDFSNDLCFLNHSTEMPNHNLNDPDNTGYFTTFDTHSVVKDISNSVCNVQDQQLFQIGYSSDPSVYATDLNHQYVQSSSSSHYVLGAGDGSCNNNLMDIGELGTQMYTSQMDIQMSLDEDTKNLNNNLNELSHMIAQDNMCHPFSLDTNMC